MGIRNASNLTASAQLAGGGGGSQVLWEWNGTDITQFGNGSGTPDYTYGTPDGTLAVTSNPETTVDVPSGNVLKYTTGTATSAYAIFHINDLPSLPERFIYRMRLSSYDTGCAPFMHICGQDGTHHATFGWYTTQTTFAMGNNNDGLYSAGIYLRSGGPNHTNRVSGYVVEADCMLRDPDTGVDPQINVIIPGLSVVGYVKGGDSWTTWNGSGAAYDSSWQSGGTIKNPGVLFTCDGTAQVAWVSEMQILSHPWAREG